MKTKELIELLQDNDPDGDLEVILHHWYNDNTGNTRLKYLSLDKDKCYPYEKASIITLIEM